MITGKLDGDLVKQTSKSPILQSTHQQESTQIEWNEWRDYTSKGFMFMTKSITMFKWNGINFKLHGFWLAMLAIDMLWSMISNLSPSWLILAFIRNAILFSIIFGVSFIRIKTFGSKQINATQQVQLTFGDIDSIEQNEEANGDDSDLLFSDDEYDSANIDFSANQAIGSTQSEQTDTEIQFGSVIITYLGGIITLKQMSKSIMRQCQYFAFSAVFHFALAILFWMTSNEHQQWLFLWLKNANFYCMIMCLLPVPGFDGAALLTIYLKQHKWRKFAISAILLASSCIVTVLCGLMALLRIDIVALYLAIYSGFKIIQFVANPKDDNMRVLKAMAGVTSNASEPKTIMKAQMATNLV